jgi:hypothetical protein
MKLLNRNINFKSMFQKQEPRIKRGILLFAVGHYFYGKMAAALAATIKVSEDIPICLLYHGGVLSELTEQEKALFTKIIEIDDEFVHNKDGSFNPIKARMHFYELTPFQETLCLDVDNAWLNMRKPSEVFAELANVSFTIQNAGYTTCDGKADQYFSVWSNIHETIKSYGIQNKKFYKVFGEWIYFKRDPTARKIYTTARRIFSTKPKIKMPGFIGQEVPDELAFTIAMAQTEIYPHKDSYHPTTYFHIVSRAKMRYAHVWDLADKYYTISMGGSVNPEFTIKNYNVLVAAAYQKLGLQNPFTWKQKKNFLLERKTA